MAEPTPASYCLPGYLVDKFVSALEKELDPDELALMSSGRRRKALEDILGPDHAEQVNILFEKKLGLKNQQLGLARWVDQVSKAKPVIKKDMSSKIQKMDRLLNPTELADFKADLAKDELSFNVTAEQAKEIFDQSNKVENLKTAMKDTPDKSLERRAYGLAVQAMRENLQNMMPDNRGVMNHLVDWWNIPATAKTGFFHLSANLVQNWGMAGQKVWFESFPEMLKHFASEENSRNQKADMLGDSDWQVISSVIPFTDVSDRVPSEEMQSPILKKAFDALSEKTGAPNILQISSRAFTGTNNFVKWNTAKNYLTGARAAGLDVSMGSEVLQNLGTVVNNFTGRSSLLDKFDQLNPILRAVFWTPKKFVATVQKFNPIYYAKLDPFSRGKAFQNLVGSLMMTGATLGLAQMAGFKVGWDPDNQDYLKVTLPGGAEMDIPGSDFTFHRLMYRLARNGYYTATGRTDEIPPNQDDIHEVGRYIRGKFSMMTGTLFDGLWGNDPVGRPFSVTQKVRDDLYPILLDSGLDYFNSDSDKLNGSWPLVLSLFGAGLQSPRPAEMTGGLGFDPENPLAGPNSINFWGEPSNPFNPEPPNDIDKEANRLHFALHLPPNRINGQLLTHQQYLEYITDSGQHMKDTIEPMMNDPSWNEMSDTDKRGWFKIARDKGRSWAAADIGISSSGTDNDITQKAYDKKFGVQK